MTSNRIPAGQHAKRAVRATIWSGINSVIPIVTSLGVFVITARVLTPHDFGTVAFATGLALLGAILCPGGLGEAIIQRLEISEQQLSSVFWLCVGCGVVAFGLECAAAPPLARYFKIPVLAALIPVVSSRIIADMAAVVPNALLARAMSFHLIAMRTFIVSMVAAAITVGLLLAGFGIWALVVSQLASSYVVMVVAFLAIRWYPRLTFSMAAVKELLGYGLFSSGTQTLTKAMQQNEQILVGLFLGTTQLGLYNFSKQVLNVFNNVVAGSLGAVAHPMFSGIQNDRERVKKGFLNATFVSSLIAFPMFIGLAVAAPKIVPLAFGPHWLHAIVLIQLQCCLGLLLCVGTLQAGLITSQGKANWWFYYYLLKTIMNALVIVICAHWGLFAMLWVYVIVNYMLMYIPVRVATKLLQLPAMNYIRNFSTPAFGTLCMGVAVLGANALLKNCTNLELVAIDVVLGVIVYCATVLAVDAGRIQAFLALIAPKFSKTTKMA